jgi:hypothetical protein
MIFYIPTPQSAARTRPSEMVEFLRMKNFFGKQMGNFWSPLKKNHFWGLHSCTKFRTDPLAKLYDIRVSFKSLIWSGCLSSPKRGSSIVHFVVLSSWPERNWRIKPAWRSRAGFRKFSKKKNSCIARARRGRTRLTVYPPWIQIADVSAATSQSYDRKSKFRLRHAIKLSQLYGVTKSEFRFSMIPPSTNGGNVRSSVYSTRQYTHSTTSGDSWSDRKVSVNFLYGILPHNLLHTVSIQTILVIFRFP